MDLEKQAAAFRREIIGLAATRGLDSGVVCLALADVLGITAAMLDRRDGVRELDDRLHSFTARVRERYETVRSARERLSVPGAAGR